MSKDSLALEGHIKLEVVRDGEVIETVETKNLIVNTGLNSSLDATLLGGAQTSNWYVALLDNYTPVATMTPTNLAANEVQAYSEGARPGWTGVRTNQTASNTVSKAQFTINADNTDVYGAALVSSNVKGGTGGVLFAAGTFTAARTGLMTSDELYITYEITSASA